MLKNALRYTLLATLILSIAATASAEDLEYQTVSLENISVEVPADWEMEDFTEDNKVGKKHEENDFYFVLALFDMSGVDLSEYDLMGSISSGLDETFADHGDYTVVSTYDLSNGTVTSVWETVTANDYGYESTDSLCYVFDTSSNTALFLRMESYHSYDSAATDNLIDIMTHAINSLKVVTYAEESASSSTVPLDDYEELQTNYDGLQANYDDLQKRYDELSENYDSLLAEYENIQANSETETETEELPKYNVKGTIKAVTDSSFTVYTSKGNTYTFSYDNPELNVGDTVTFVYRGNVSSSYDIQPGTVKKLEVTEEASEDAKYETGITYDNLARNPDDYIGSFVKFKGKVVQIIEDSSGVNHLRLYVDSDYNQTVSCWYSADIVDSRILEDDIITIYGASLGLYSYTSTIGVQITIPSIFIEKIER